MAGTIQLQTKRLLLRSIKPEDATAVFNYRTDALTNQYQGWIPTTVDDAIDFIENKTSPEIDIINTWHQLVIILKDKNVLIGDIGIHFLDKEQKQVEIGCTLNKTFQGIGYASEALTETISYLFNTLNKHRIIASLDPRNTKSIALVKRLDFKLETHNKGSLLVNGVWVDDMVYVLGRDERR